MVDCVSRAETRPGRRESVETMRVLITVVALTPTMLLGVPIGAARQEHRLQVRMGTAEAEAVLAILDARARGEDVAYGAWDRLLATEGYRRLKEREAAMQRAEKLRQEMASLRPAGLDITISIGMVCSLDFPKEHLNQFLTLADKALYAAKERGRNRVCLHTDDGVVDSPWHEQQIAN